MIGISDIKKELGKIQELEKELNLKQVQINRLLSITQAINNNTSAKKLYEMYQSFLGYEMGIQKMVLYVRSSETWDRVSTIGVKDTNIDKDIESLLSKYKALDHLNDANHPFIKEFDVVIPVSHKDRALAYVFLGGFKEDDDMYDKVQFITALTNVIAVAIENKRLFRQQIRQERLKHEMKLASAMQRSMVPDQLPSKDCYQLASIYKPHLSVGGDYFDFMEFGDGTILFCVGDISGKGLAAALLMANFQAIFHTLVNKRDSLEKFVEEVNLALFQITGGDRFITFFVAVYDMFTKKLTYVNAGHNPPVIVQNGVLQQLTKGTTLLGCFEELPFLEIGEVAIDEEAMVLVYTDGLTDIQDDEGNYLGMDFIESFVPQHYKLSAEAFNERLLEVTENFVGDEQDYPDDFTVLTCKLFTPENICM
ncbi:MAG: PP2C family protein-serine/threonine phosphatase [Bacteroidota bacterium]